MTHSTVVGGSSASRVLNCPASIRLSQDIPRSPPSSYAREGTAMHAIMERWLLDEDINLSDFVGMTIEEVKITTDHFVDLIEPAKAATLEAFTRLDVSEFEPEARVHFKTIPGAFGTCDILAKGRDDLVVLLDYKFGSGHLISPVENTQLMFYAAAAIEDPEFADWWTGDLDQPIMVGIIQPAAEHVLSTWQTTVRDCTRFTMELMVAVDKAEKPHIEPSIGDWCRWCPAAPVCPAKLNAAAAIDNLKEEHLNDLAVAMALAEDLEPWIKQVKTLAHQQLERGDRIEGFKLVRKRAVRKWADEAAMLKTLKNSKRFKAEEYITEKMCTPPQFEKLCKSKKVDFEQFTDSIVAVSSGTTLAPEDDPREGVVMSASREIPESLAKLITETEPEK